MEGPVAVSGALSRVEKSSRRTHQVKVTLNEEELERLDELVKASGADRASVFRALLAKSSAGQALSSSANPLQVADQPDPGGLAKPSIYMAEPKSFDEVVTCVDALRKGNAVTLNLTLLDPTAAQRGVDFVAGGVYALCGAQERLGEAIFLFSTGLTVKDIAFDEAIKAHVAEVNRELGAHSPANPPLLNGGTPADTEC